MDLFDYSNYESDSFIDSAPPPRFYGPADPLMVYQSILQMPVQISIIAIMN